MSHRLQLSRRQVIASAGVLGVAGGAGVAGVAGVAGTRARDAAAESVAGRQVEFHGPHQAGVATPVQGNLHFAAYDVADLDRAALIGLLQDWTATARELTASRRVGGIDAQSRLAPPSDTGEALGLGAANLTVTVGFGPDLFTERVGLAGERPAALADLPPFAGNLLDRARCGGDLALQVCADDPQVALHAVRNLTRIAAGRAAVRWTQLGFGAASPTAAAPTPRNLFGFKDGTANIPTDDRAELAEHVWAHSSDGSPWMAGGSYLVARRIRMTIETWDRTSLHDQEAVMGRTKDVGAPLGSARERDTVRPAVLPASSHVRMAHPSRHGGARLLRRGFNFVDGTDELGHLDAGLFFLAFQRDPRRAFVPIQTELASHDAMSTYIRHTGSSLWAVPPGVGPSGWWGETLLG